MSEPTCKQQVRSHLNSRISDLTRLWKDYTNGDEGLDDLGRFNEYGLCFDYVPAHTFTDQPRGFFRYQLSTGGPGDEFRFYVDETFTPYRIEYWFLDWYDGAKIVLKGKAEALLLDIWNDFKECDVPQNAMKQAIS